MPTYVFSRTREQVRDMILRRLGEGSDGQTPTAESAEIVYEAMNLRLRELHTMSLSWFNVAGAQTSVDLTGGTATATIDVDDFLYAVSAMFVNGTSQQPVTIVDHRTYQAIPEKTEQGEPEQAYISGETVYLWPVPQTDGTLKITYQAFAPDAENATALDVPTQILRPFVNLCAFDLIGDFEVSSAMAQRIAVQAEPAMREIRALIAQRVDATTVAPEWF